TIASQNRARINHRVTANLCSIPNNRAKFRETGGDRTFVCGYANLAVIEFHVRQNHARTEVRLKSKNRIADVIKMRHLSFVENDAVLELARVAHDDTVADDDILADVAAAANLTILADPGRSLQNCALFDNGAAANE